MPLSASLLIGCLWRVALPPAHHFVWEQARAAIVAWPWPAADTRVDCCMACRQRSLAGALSCFCMRMRACARGSPALPAPQCNCLGMSGAPASAPPRSMPRPSLLPAPQRRDDPEAQPAAHCLQRLALPLDQWGNAEVGIRHGY